LGKGEDICETGCIVATLSVEELLKRLRGRSPAGFAIALHITFTTPRYLFQSYQREWIDQYSSQGMVMRDPTVHWAFSNTGTIRWSDLAGVDPSGVLAEAAQHGMRFGATLSLDAGGSKSMASFSRADREISEIELAALGADLRQLHLRTLGAQTLDQNIHETLRHLSIYLTHG
jgi:LuxR family transcriptional regulator